MKRYLLKKEKNFLKESLVQRQKQLEELLKAAEDRYEIIRALGAVYQEITVIDLKKQTYTVVSGCNGVEKDRILTGTIQEFQDYVRNELILPEEEEAREFLDFSTAAERLRDKQFVAHAFKCRDGLWYLVTLVVKNRDNNGNVTHILVLARNVNEHENHFDDRELLLENHKKMTVAANHLLALINDVLEMSKLEDGSVVLTHEFISLVDLTRDIVTIVVDRATEAGIEWDYEKGKSNIPYPYIYGSPVHLRQIFLNIYGNCIKYNHPGGKITTIVDTRDEKDRICTYRWTIADIGVGMSEEFLQHIFEPFAQEKNDARSDYQGTGLGMAIVKSLLDQMGGTISITSKVGAGTIFVIEIPFEIAPSPENMPQRPLAQEQDIRGLHLMLAEDNELNAEIAQMLLQDKGAQITLVSDGKQTLELFEASPAGTFDGILMDIMMPVMDGLTATRHIRALERVDAKKIPIIAMTANAFHEDAERCLAAGMNEHLSKPLEISKVVAAIAEYCRKECGEAQEGE